MSSFTVMRSESFKWICDLLTETPRIFLLNQHSIRFLEL